MRRGGVDNDRQLLKGWMMSDPAQDVQAHDLGQLEIQQNYPRQRPGFGGGCGGRHGSLEQIDGLQPIRRQQDRVANACGFSSEGEEKDIVWIVFDMKDASVLHTSNPGFALCAMTLKREEKPGMNISQASNFKTGLTTQPTRNQTGPEQRRNSTGANRENRETESLLISSVCSVCSC
jgi:hypothetical protein